MAKKTGTSTGGIETSTRYRRKQAARRKAEEREWAEKSGPVLIRIGDSEYYLKSDQVREDLARLRRAILGDDQEELAELVRSGVVRPGS